MAKLKWVAEIEVDETWVTDGFNLTDDRLRGILERTFPYAYGHEFAGRVIEAPSAELIKQLQGQEDD